VVTPADEQDRAQGADLAAQVQAVTGEAVKLAYVDHVYWLLGTSVWKKLS